MSKEIMNTKTGKGVSKLSFIYKWALPIYILYVLVFELFAKYSVSDIWSRMKKIFNKSNKGKFIKLKLRDR